MSKILNRATVLFFVLVLTALCQMADAQVTGDQQKALDAITTTADRICNVVKAEGDAQSTKVSGDVKAELSGLARQLANLGISGTASLDTSEYHGLLQQDLALALKDNAACKQHIFDKLMDKLLASPERKSGESTIQLKVDDNQGIVLSNVGEKISNVDVTSDARLLISCSRHLVFSQKTEMIRYGTEATGAAFSLIGVWGLDHLSGILSDLRRELKAYVEFAMRIMVEYEGSDHNARRRNFGIECSGPKMTCTVLELGPRAYDSFYREKEMDGAVTGQVYLTIYGLSGELDKFVTETRPRCG